MIIYSDLDFTLHHYTPAFVNAFLDMFGIEIDGCKLELFSGDWPLNVILTDYPQVTEKMLKMVCREVDKDTNWEPLPWQNCLVNALYIRQKKKRDSLRIVTARSCGRKTIEQMTRGMFGTLSKNIHTFLCSRNSKHLMIKDGSIVFEDLAPTANLIGENCYNSLVFVPKWRWNEFSLQETENVKFLDFNRLKSDESALEFFEEVEEKLEDLALFNDRLF